LKMEGVEAVAKKSWQEEKSFHTASTIAYQILDLTCLYGVF